VVDDCSTRDDPEGVVRALGSRRVGFFRQPQNVGHSRNFDTCLHRARGHLVHLLHGDDGVRPGFYRIMARPFQKHPEIGAAYCRYITINERGTWLSMPFPNEEDSGILARFLEKIGAGNRLQPPCLVVRRAVYEELGGFDHRFARYGEDWEMSVRIATRFPIWHEMDPLALYRVHASSLSGQSVTKGAHGAELRLAIELNRAHLAQLGPARAAAITAEARRNFGVASVRRGHRMLDNGQLAGPVAHAREALKTCRTPDVLLAAAGLLGRWAWLKLRS
jgi:hypothetical protein